VRAGPASGQAAGRALSQQVRRPTTHRAGKNGLRPAPARKQGFVMPLWRRRTFPRNPTFRRGPGERAPIPLAAALGTSASARRIMVGHRMYPAGRKHTQVRDKAFDAEGAARQQVFQSGGLPSGYRGREVASAIRWRFQSKGFGYGLVTHLLGVRLDAMVCCDALTQLARSRPSRRF
jgi:hypothetical protein